ncbi:snRNA-activating protein complex subunit 3-like isoform X2 [Harmonia axyridis]|uniref:snRNA-activating protein complex subunit 3-like isoform X2 n=1 Tax=Harmonia axyridis TaxID=115357 RepID=UPI001E27546C|nr:snRNA-activating protein complex subunit 3-like isoform X2 [Harmonia axyridis]
MVIAEISLVLRGLNLTSKSGLELNNINWNSLSSHPTLVALAILKCTYCFCQLYNESGNMNSYFTRNEGMGYNTAMANSFRWSGVMESIYEPERFKASPVINLSEHFTNYSNIISNSTVTTKELSEETLESLEESCSIDQLMCDGEIKIKPLAKPENYNLRKMLHETLPFTQKYTKLKVLQTKAMVEKERSCESILYGNKENFHQCVVTNHKEEGSPRDMEPRSDFLLNVIFYKPFKFTFHKKNTAGRFRFNHEIQILGNNTLTQLRDQIICQSDVGLQVEVDSPTSDISHLMNAKKHYPSGCFFIEGVLYDDMRSPNAIEYSKEIIEWGLVRNVADFKKADMDKTKIKDLSLRFGYPYVYMHQGECEHIMVFGDGHILTENDCLNSKMYPRLYSLNKQMCTVCYMCNDDAACWIVKDYDRLPQSITYLCSKCTESYCTIDGKKIGEYKLYPLFVVS